MISTVEHLRLPAAGLPAQVSGEQNRGVVYARVILSFQQPTYQNKTNIVLFPFQVVFFVSSELLKCRLWKCLFAHPTSCSIARTRSEFPGNPFPK